MAVLEQLGPFTLHGTSPHKNWIKWHSDTDNLWLQYNLAVVAFHFALVDTVTLQWKSRRGNGSYAHTFTKEWWQELAAASPWETYTHHIMQLRKHVDRELGWDCALERCILPDEEDAIALLDELNCAWVYQQLRQTVDDT